MTSKRTLILIVVTLGMLTLGTVIASASHASPYIDLTTLNAIVTHNGAQFVQSGSGAGTGNWNPFLTYNVPGSDPNEKGYNSDGPAQFDEFYGGGRTHPIQLAAIPTVDIGGVIYREFGLDSNDTGRDDYMSIDEFKIFVDNQSDLDSYSEATETFGNDDDLNKDKIFDMDDNCGASPEGCTVFMRTQSLSSGSGVSDIIIRVPDSAFGSFPDCYYGSLTCGQYVYVWSAMGYYTGPDPVPGDQNWNTNSGFEEWQTREAPVVNVSKTADTSYTQDYNWMVDKKVKVDGTCEDSASVNLFTGESQDAEWCIDVTRTLGAQSDQTVFGEITIFNPTGGDVIPEDIDAVITSVNDVISSADFTDINAAVDCGVTFPYTLGAGESLVCTYSESTPAADNATTGTNTATVVVTDAGTDFEATAPFDFANTDPSNIAETNASATLTDDEGSLDQLFTGNGSTSYTNTYACDADEGDTSNTAVITPSDGGTPDDDTATLTLNCYQISVSKDASTSFTRTWNWTISKSVDPELWQLFTGETGTSEYTVSVDKVDYTDSDWAVEGSITVSNAGNPIPATINSVSDVISPSITASVSCGVSFPHEIAAGGSLVCSYGPQSLPNADTRTNTATVEQQLHDYDKDGNQTDDGTQDYSGNATIDFSDNPVITEVYASINVTDTNGQSWGPVSDDTTFPSYTKDFTCDSDEGTHGNTATITETGQTATASVTVECYDLTVTKTADEFYTRYFEWYIDKIVDNPGPITVPPGGSVILNYDVEVGLLSTTDNDWQVTGDITIANSHPNRDADLNLVIDDAGSISGVVDCDPVAVGTQTSGTVPASSSLTCTYDTGAQDSADANPFGATNTATATQQLYDFDKDLNPTANGTKDYSGTWPINFSQATISYIDEEIDVNDTYAGFLGTVNALTDTLPKTFTYQRTVTADITFCGTFTVDNTADFVTNDTGATGDDSVSVVIDVPCQGCTPGFWQGGAGAPLWDGIPADPDPGWTGEGTNPYIHSTLFNDFFDDAGDVNSNGSVDVDSALNGFTMYALVSSGGGSNWAEKAARDMVAAYLNESAFPDAFPADSLDALLIMWYDAVAGGDAGYQAFHLLVSGWNAPAPPGFCPLP